MYAVWEIWPGLNFKDETTGILIKAAPGVVPPRSEFLIEELLPNTDKYNSMWGNLSENIKSTLEKIKAYSILYFNSHNKKLFPEGIDIYIPIPDGFNLDEIFAVCVAEGVENEKFPVTIHEENGIKYAKFTTTHFSDFAIYDTANAKDVTENGDGTNTENDAVKTGDQTSYWIIGLGTLALLSAGALLFVKRRKSSK